MTAPDRQPQGPFVIRVSTRHHEGKVIAQATEEGDARLIARALNALDPSMLAIFDYRDAAELALEES